MKRLAALFIMMSFLMAQDSTLTFDKIFKDCHEVKVNKLPYRSPNLNPYAEAWVSLVKRECLNFFFVFGVEHLKYLLNEYLTYYNNERPHAGLKNLPLDFKVRKSGKIKCEERLGGIINHYYRN